MHPCHHAYVHGCTRTHIHAHMCTHALHHTENVPKRSSTSPYAHTRARAHTSARISTHARTHMRTHIMHERIHMHTCTHARTRRYLYAHAYMNMCAHAHMQGLARTHKRAHTRTHARMKMRAQTHARSTAPWASCFGDVRDTSPGLPAHLARGTDASGNASSDLGFPAAEPLTTGRDSWWVFAFRPGHVFSST